MTTRDDTPIDRPAATTPAAHFEEALRLFDSMVGRIGPDDWDRATPCEDWDVRLLVNHVTSEDLWVSPLLAGRTIAEIGDRFDGDVLGESPATAWSKAAWAALDAVKAPNGLDRQVHLSSGPAHATEYVAELSADHLIHSWDLAVGLGIDLILPDHLVAACAEWFTSMEELYRSAGAIGPRVDLPPDADPQTRLLAAFGRKNPT